MLLLVVASMTSDDLVLFKVPARRNIATTSAPPYQRSSAPSRRRERHGGNTRLWAQIGVARAHPLGMVPTRAVRVRSLSDGQLASAFSPSTFTFTRSWSPFGGFDGLIMASLLGRRPSSCAGMDLSVTSAVDCGIADRHLHLCARAGQ